MSAKKRLRTTTIDITPTWSGMLFEMFRALPYMKPSGLEVMWTELGRMAKTVAKEEGEALIARLRKASPKLKRDLEARQAAYAELMPLARSADAAIAYHLGKKRKASRKAGVR